jgi:hypothetical protein
MCHYDFLRKFSQGTRLKEEPSIEVDVRWQRRPLLSRDCVSIKDCPDRTTPLCPSPTPASAAFMKLFGLYLAFLALT